MKNFGILTAVAAFVFTTSITAQEGGQIAMTDTATEVVTTMEAYEPIEISALPEAVVTAISTEFSGATVAEAYKDKDDNYKVVLTVGEESKTVYADAAGKWIEPNE